MKPVFVAFVITACLLLAVTTVLGTLVEGPRYFDQHFAVGLVTTLFLCLVHTVVFTYFMATGKMMKLAIEEADLDANLFDRVRGCKARVFRTLMPAIMIALAAAFAGGWATDHPDSATIHLVLVLASVAVQLAAWRAEYGVIAENGRLMDEVFRRHAALKGASHDV